jgi:hypothetical protein
MATPAPITGANHVSIGYTIQLSDATIGGVWSSSNDTIATVSSAGVVTGVTLGVAVISYTTDDGAATCAISVRPVMISNGFNINDLFPVFQQRLGWLPSGVEGMPEISEANQLSYSGRYYNDDSFHPSVSIQNIYEICQDVLNASETEFNDLLDRMDKSVIMRTVNAIFNRPALIEHKTIYTRTYNVLNVQIPNGGNFVGYRFNIAKGNYAVMFNAISLYFNGDATFNLYMFNDLVKEPLKVKRVTAIANSQTRVQLDWVVNYINLHNLGGVIFIGYFQNEIEDQGVNALDEQLNLWECPKAFGAYPFQAAQLGDLSNPDFYRVNPSIVYRTYGLNMEVSSYRDYTQTIMQNAHLFDEVRGLCMAITVISIIKNSGRTNSTQRIADVNLNDLKIDMDLAFPTQDLPFVAGLKAQLARALKQLNDNFWPKAVPLSVTIGGNTGIADYLGMNINDLPPRETIV